MKSKFRCFVLIFLFCATVIVVSGWFWGASIRGDKILFAFAPLYHFFFPPDDLYHPILLLDLDKQTAPTEMKSTFSVKYIGAYSFGVYTKELPRLADEPCDGKVNISVVIRDRDQVLFTSSGVMASPFWEVAGKSGLELGRFYAPSDVPTGEELVCIVSVQSVDQAFYELYGPLRFYVSKASDE